MAAKRKRVAMFIVVTVPKDMTARDARREVRTLVNEQCNYSADEGDLKVISVQPVAGRDVSQ